MIRESSNTTSFESIDQATKYAVQQLVEFGNPYVAVDYISAYNLHQLRVEAESRLRSPLLKSKYVTRKNHGAQDGWQGVDRLTFFTLRNAETNRDKFLTGIALNAFMWARHARTASGLFSESLRQEANSNSISALADWRPNRIGFNVYNGSEERNALAAPHTDVKTEHGVVIALDLSSMSGKAESPLRGNLSFIFGYDTCAELGLEQPLHDVVAKSRRLSLTLADLRPSLANTEL